MEVTQGLNRRRLGDQTGFTLIDGMVALVLVTVGLVGMLSLFSLAIITMDTSDDESLARQKAREALESIFTARNTQQVDFDQIQNVNQGGIFLAGFQPMTTPGVDGLVGTADDGGIEVVNLAGEDGLMGTGDDEQRVLDRFEREISISQLSTRLRQIDVTIRFSLRGGTTRDYRITSFISKVH